MSEEWKAGDVVRLKSGGPFMTVVEQNEDQWGSVVVWCEWFDEKNKPQRETFTPSSLEIPPAKRASATLVRR